MSPVSRGSTSCSYFPGYSLVRVSQTAVSAIVHCNLTDRFVMRTCTMSMNDRVCSNLSTLLSSIGERGGLIAAGQVAKATDRSNRRAMPTGGVGSSIGGWLLGKREETATGAWTVCPLHQAPWGVGRVDKRGRLVRHSTVRLQLKILHKVLRVAALHNIA